MDKVYYIVGLRGQEISRRVIDNVSSEEQAKKLFVAFTGADTIVTCCEATVRRLVRHIRELESEINSKVFDAVSKAIRDFALKDQSKPGRKKHKKGSN